MTHPEESRAATSPATGAEAASETAGPMVMAAPRTGVEAAPSGGRSQVAAPPQPTPAPTEELVFSPGTPARRVHPLLGPTLSVYAVLLWAFVVAGQFTTSWSFGRPLGGDTATFLVMIATFTAWLASLRRSHVAVPPRTTGRFVWRAIGIGVLALLLFLVTVVAATALGGISSGNHDLLIALVLLLISLFTAIAGPRMTTPSAPSSTHGQRVARVLMWIACALLTLVAGADLAAQG